MAVVVVVVEVAAVVFPWSRSTSPESGAGAGIPGVCGLSTTVLLLLLSVGRGAGGMTALVDRLVAGPADDVAGAGRC